MHTWENGFFQVADGVYAYVTEGVTMMSNAAIVIGDECALVFDSLITVPETQKFIDCCKSVTDKPIKYVIESHVHGDHCHGVHLFEDAVVIGHKDIRSYMDFYSKKPKADDQKNFPHLDFTGAKYTYPDIYITGDIEIDLGGRAVQIRHRGQCHTNHDVFAVVPDSNTVICGDAFFYQVCPVTVLGDVKHWAQVLESWLDEGFEHYVPGHGPIADTDGVKQFAQYLTMVDKAAKVMAEEGLVAEDALDTDVMGEYILNWKEPYRMLETLDDLCEKYKGGSGIRGFDPNRVKLHKERLENIKNAFSKSL